MLTEKNKNTNQKCKLCYDTGVVKAQTSKLKGGFNNDIEKQQCKCVTTRVRSSQ